MQAILDIPTLAPLDISQADAQRLADRYLANTLGAEFHTVRGTVENDRWFFLIRCQRADLPQPCIVGRVTVDPQRAAGRGAVVPLTADQIREIHECADWEVARSRGELARDADGYVSRHQARRLARRWLDHHVSMKCGASGGTFMPLAPPVWQFSIYFHLETIHLEPLGVIKVDAHTGEVQSLDNEQLENLREQVCAVIQP